MSCLSKEIELLERLYSYSRQGYSPYDIKQALETVMRVVIRIEKEVQHVEKELENGWKMCCTM